MVEFASSSSIPRGQLVTWVLISGLWVSFLVVTYAGLIVTVPRAGGDYIWQSRLLGGGLGFVVSSTGLWFILWLWAPIYGTILSEELFQPVAVDFGQLGAAQWFASSMVVSWQPWSRSRWREPWWRSGWRVRPLRVAFEQCLRGKCAHLADIHGFALRACLPRICRRPLGPPTPRDRSPSDPAEDPRRIGQNVVRGWGGGRSSGGEFAIERIRRSAERPAPLSLKRADVQQRGR